MPGEIGIQRLEQILNSKFLSSDFAYEISVREYIKELLLELFREVENFSGKRPFGNSGWIHDIEAHFVASGFIPGKVDADGYVEESEGFQELMESLIHYLCHGNNKG